MTGLSSTIRRRKRTEYWQETMETQRSTPAKLWRSVGEVLVRGRPQSSSVVDVDTFNKFFFNKVAKVQAAIAEAKSPTFTAVRTGLSMRSFSRLSAEDVTRSIGQLPGKIGRRPTPYVHPELEAGRQ